MFICVEGQVFAELPPVVNGWISSIESAKDCIVQLVDTLHWSDKASVSKYCQNNLFKAERPLGVPFFEIL